jgi:hypothetical protein
MHDLGAAGMAHGTTVATNALLERRGARTAFVTTAGFEHLLLIGRQNRPSLYDLRIARPPPAVPRERCFGVHERVDERGRVLRVPTNHDLEDLARPKGLEGGDDGRPGKNLLVRSGRRHPLPAKVTLELRRGDLLVIETPGGGGWGPPERRRG